MAQRMLADCLSRKWASASPAWPSLGRAVVVLVRAPLLVHREFGEWRDLQPGIRDPVAALD